MLLGAGAFMPAKLSFQKVGEGSGNEAVEVGEFLDRCFLDLAWVIKPNAPQPTTHTHHRCHRPLIPLQTFVPFLQTHSHLHHMVFAMILLIQCIQFPDGGFLSHMAIKRVSEEQSSLFERRILFATYYKSLIQNQSTLDQHITNAILYPIPIGRKSLGH